MWRQELVPARSRAQPPEGGCLGGVARREGEVKLYQFPPKNSRHTHTQRNTQREMQTHKHKNTRICKGLKWIYFDSRDIYHHA